MFGADSTLVFLSPLTVTIHLLFAKEQTFPLRSFRASFVPSDESLKCEKSKRKPLSVHQGQMDQSKVALE
jgi:hypothetical protein